MQLHFIFTAKVSHLAGRLKKKKTNHTTVFYFQNDWVLKLF